MGNPPIALTLEAQKMAKRTRKARQFLVFLRARRHARWEAAFQETRAKTSSPAPGGPAPVEAGMLALAPLVQAYGHGSDRDAVARTVRDKRGQRGLDGRGAAQPPGSRGTVWHGRRRLIAHHLATTWLERTVTVAAQTGGCGSRQLRAALASPPLCGAGRVADTLHRLGPARRTAGGGAAQARGTSTETMGGEAGGRRGGHRRRKAARDLDGGQPTTREHALRVVLEAVARGQRWLAPPPGLSGPAPRLQEGLDPVAQMVAQATEPDPTGGPGGPRLKPHGAPARRVSIEDQARRHGRTSRAKTCNGGTEPLALALDRTVTREVVVRPAHEPAQAAVAGLAEA